jgi:hypothetical protein
VRAWLTRLTRDSLRDEFGRGNPVPTLALKLETREAEVGLETPGGSPLGVFDRISRMVLRIGPDAVGDDPDVEDTIISAAL